MPKQNIDILNDGKFQSLPTATRVGVLEKLHEILLESSMAGGFCEQLLALRDEGKVDMARQCVFIMRTDDEHFPKRLKDEKSTAIYHRELISLDDPKAWPLQIEAVKKRAAQTTGQIPRATWLLAPKPGEKDSPKEQRPADMWGLTYMDGAAVLHAIDLDVQLDFLHERAKKETP